MSTRQAAAKGIAPESVEASVEGDIDVRDEALKELCQLSPTYSPIFNTFTQAVPVTVELDR